ncbi:MAG: hypothetical protein ACOX52_14795 [Verrucomicrobiota bacterium]
MIGLIGNPSYPYSYSYSPHHRVRGRVPLRCVRVRFWAELEAVRKGLRIRMGRDPAEIAEGAEVYWEGLHRSRIQQLPWSTETVSLNNTPKK